MATATAKKTGTTDTAEAPEKPVLTADSDGVPALAKTALIYVDKVYTSRTLILPRERTVQVAQGRVTVDPADVELLDYLAAHPDFSPAG
ncbi:hypothetical protein [Pseudomonas viridiflava]|uniref:hypothetical protein n=1 Tax=Pseudomonas viridiflava TaxID=33069 RepID=UPI000F02FDD8|nr:hypothetical protein [Pseudomonas viridiflava]